MGSPFYKSDDGSEPSGTDPQRLSLLVEKNKKNLKVMEGPVVHKRKYRLLIQTVFLFTCDQIKVHEAEFQLFILYRAACSLSTVIYLQSLFVLIY